MKRNQKKTRPFWKKSATVKDGQTIGLSLHTVPKPNPRSRPDKTDAELWEELKEAKRIWDSSMNVVSLQSAFERIAAIEAELGPEKIQDFEIADLKKLTEKLREATANQGKALSDLKVKKAWHEYLYYGMGVGMGLGVAYAAFYMTFWA